MRAREARGVLAKPCGKAVVELMQGRAPHNLGVERFNTRLCKAGPSLVTVSAWPGRRGRLSRRQGLRPALPMAEPYWPWTFKPPLKR